MENFHKRNTLDLSSTSKSKQIQRFSIQILPKLYTNPNNLMKEGTPFTQKLEIQPNRHLSERIAIREELYSNDETKETLKREIEQLLKIIHIQQKEINTLKEMNKHLLMSNQSKLDLLYEERKMQLTSPKNIKPLAQQTSSSQQIEYLSQTSFKVQSGSKLDTNIQIQARKRASRMQQTRLIQSLQDDVTKSETISKEQANLAQLLTFMQIEECFKISTILNLHLMDSEAQDLYENDGTILLLNKIIQDEDDFLEIVQNSGVQRLSFLFDKIKRLVSEHRQLFNLILRLKQIIQGAQQMSECDVLDDALNTIVDEITSCLQCDRASCFVVDHAKNELWSKVAKGTSSVIRVPIGSGLSGYVAANKELLNIQNAYLDQRFNQEHDVRTNYKTKTVLACPIMDRDRCLGVLQCVNKMEGNFNKDDEALLTILSEFSRVVLNNAINHDEQLLVQNKLRHLIKTGLILTSAANNLQNLIIQAEQRLKSLMNVQYAKVCILSSDKTNFIHLVEQKFKITPSDIGIMGSSVTSKKMNSLFNCYLHPMFNPAVDIETQSAIVTMPVFHPENPELDDVIGCIQVVNAKGFSNLFQQLLPKLTAVDQEALEFLCKQIAQCILIYSVNNQINLDQPELNLQEN